MKSSTDSLENQRIPKLIYTHRVELYAGGKATKPIDASELLTGSQADFRKLIASHERVARGEKHVVGAFVPVFFRGDGKVLRRKVNVTGGPACVWLDLDHVPEKAFEAMCLHIRERGWCGEAWSTASYDPESGEVSARLRLNASRKQSADEVRLCRVGLSSELTKVASAAVPEHSWKREHVADAACFQSVAIFYMPAVYEDRAGTERAWLFDGRSTVDVDKLIESLPAAVKSAEKRREAGARKRAEMGLEGDDMIEATEAHREAARGEVEALALRIEGCQSGLRNLTELGVFALGRYVAAGVLDEGETRTRLRSAAKRQRLVHGDASFPSVEGRYHQIDVGLAEGQNEGPALPTTAEEADAIERAEDEAFGLAGGAAELQKRLEARVPARTHTLAEARMLMGTALNEGLAGGATLLHVSAGAGKTREAAEVIATRALSGQRFVFATQEHALLREVGEILKARGVDFVHLVSPLHAEGGCTSPNRADFLAAIELGVSRYGMCECPACTTRPRRGARVYLATFGDVDRALDLAGVNAALVVDEQPELHAHLTISRRDLEWLKGGDFDAPFRGVLMAQRVVVQELARAWLAGEPPAPVSLPGEVETIDPLEAAQGWRGVRYYGGLLPARGYAHRVRLLATVLAIAAHGGAPKATEDGIEATVLTSVGAALQARQRPRVVMSATPIVSAFLEAEGWRHVRVEVEDAPGVSIRRVLNYAGRVGRKGLCPGGKVDEKAVTRIVRRVLTDHPTGSILLCTFKAVAEALRGTLAHLVAGRDVVVAHYGAIRGKNEITSRRVEGFDAYVSVGDPYTGGRDELAADAGEENLTSATWGEQVSAELGQFHARARDVRREKACRHTHYGATVPAGWHAGQDVTIVVGDSRVTGAETQREATGTLKVACWLHGDAKVAVKLGVKPDAIKNWKRRQSTPPEHLAALEGLLPASMSEWMGAMGKAYWGRVDRARFAA